MHISYQLTSDDLREALAKHGGFGTKVRSTIGFFMVVVTVLALFLQQASWAAIVPGAIGCLFIFLPRLQARQAIKNMNRILEPVEVTIADAGIDSSNSVASTKFSWDAFVRYSETKNLFSVYPNRLMLHIFPKRAFAPEEADTFRGMLEQHLGAASKAYRRKLSPILIWMIIITVVMIVLLVTRTKSRDHEPPTSDSQEQTETDPPQH